MTKITEEAMRQAADAILAAASGMGLGPAAGAAVVVRSEGVLRGSAFAVVFVGPAETEEGCRRALVVYAEHLRRVHGISAEADLGERQP